MRKVLLDTNILLRAFGAHEDDPRSPLCKRVFQELIDREITIVVPAPVVAEMLRHKKPIKLPIMKRVVVVAFDRKAANILGECGELTHPQGMPKGYWKYDSLIMACAVAASVDVIVTLDKQDYQALVAQFNAGQIEIKTAEQFIGAQSEFPFKAPPNTI